MRHPGIYLPFPAVGGELLKLRGTLTVGVVGIGLIFGDLFQRTVIAGLARLLPARRDRILARWQRLLAHFVLGSVRRIGGARVADPPRIPGRPGVLILMNHQSLLDIPLVVAALEDTYPRIVTRARYARGKPLISHMVRLYQYPLVDPGATVRSHVQDLEEAARSASTPLAIYPEGTRTRDGEIGRFKRLGLERILSARTWEVYVLVADGFWEAARLDDFLENVSRVDGRMTLLGPFESPAPSADPAPFIDEMRQRMIAALRELRSGRGGPP